MRAHATEPLPPDECHNTPSIRLAEALDRLGFHEKIDAKAVWSDCHAAPISLLI